MEANTLAKDVVWLGAAQAEAEALRGTLKLQVRALAGAVCKQNLHSAAAAWQHAAAN